MRPINLSPADLDDRISEFRERYTKASAEADRLLELYGEADGDIPIGQAEHLNRTIVARDRAADQLKRYMRMRGKSPGKSGGSVKTPERGPTLVRQRDPYDLSSLRSASKPYDLSTELVRKAPVGPFYEAQELRSRAHDAIERAPEYVEWEHRESAARLVDCEGWSPDVGNWGTYFSRYMLEHGSPRYTHAFYEYLRLGKAIGKETRSILGTSGAAGGFLVPTWIEPAVILTNSGVVNPMRQICTVETVPAQTWAGVSSSAMTAEWATTATEFSDGGPSSFAQPTISPVRADVHVTSSIEFANDSDIGTQVMRLFSDARDRLEGTGFVTGTGVQQPQGIVSKLTGVTASRLAATTNGSLGPVDVFAALNTLPARYINAASFMSHWYAQSILRAQGQAQPGFIVDIAARTTLMAGFPYFLSSAMLNAGGTTGLSTATSSTDNVLVVADYASAYTIVDRIPGLEVVVNDVVLGSNNRPSGSVSWSGFWRVGGDVTNTAAAILLQA